MNRIIRDFDLVALKIVRNVIEKTFIQNGFLEIISQEVLKENYFQLRDVLTYEGFYYAREENKKQHFFQVLTSFKNTFERLLFIPTLVLEKDGEYFLFFKEKLLSLQMFDNYFKVSINSNIFDYLNVSLLLPLKVKVETLEKDILDYLKDFIIAESEVVISSKKKLREEGLLKIHIENTKIIKKEDLKSTLDKYKNDLIQQEKIKNNKYLQSLITNEGNYKVLFEGENQYLKLK
ncbi:MAG: hypothetical protein LBM99_05725 [Bacillales bacterium]|jgi:hypothetical protein|nr:hypothetical protein [Bacillales bacterium]